MSQKTVFVIGAGASKEVNLPIGSELKKSIRDILTFTGENIRGEPGTGDQIIVNAFRQARSRDCQSLFEASAEICRAMPQSLSIDHFLYARSDNESITFCGKLAIVRTILQAEAESYLSGENIDFDRIENTWFNSFFQQLTENCKPKDLEDRMKSIALIIFNYDRCIEHYLYHALQNYYSLGPEKTITLLQDLNIFHPYGVVGSLPWQTSNNSIQYGGTPTSEQLIALSQQIKTFTEGTDKSSSSIISLRSYIKSSCRLVFLGFAFHPLNMEILSPTSSSKSPITRERKYIYATCKDISLNDQEHIINDLKERLRINKNNENLITIEIQDYKCAELFKSYKRGLSFVTKISN